MGGHCQTRKLSAYGQGEEGAEGLVLLILRAEASPGKQGGELNGSVWDWDLCLIQSLT